MKKQILAVALASCVFSLPGAWAEDFDISSLDLDIMASGANTDAGMNPISTSQGVSIDAEMSRAIELETSRKAAAKAQYELMSARAAQEMKAMGAARNKYGEWSFKNAPDESPAPVSRPAAIAPTVRSVEPQAPAVVSLGGMLFDNEPVVSNKPVQYVSLAGDSAVLRKGDAEMTVGIGSQIWNGDKVVDIDTDKVTLITITGSKYNISMRW